MRYKTAGKVAVTVLLDEALHAEWKRKGQPFTMTAALDAGMREFLPHFKERPK